MNQQHTCRLYLITPPEIELSAFAEEFKHACDGGDVAVLQLRLKDKNGNTAAPDKIKQVGETLLPLCHERGVAFIINDSADLAREIGADGVHIGEEQDGTVADARRILGEDAIVGYSCYDSRHRAMCAGEDGATYVAFGAFYPTNTKQPKGHPTPEILQWWHDNTILPSVAIGGIKPDNLAPLVQAKADFLAVVTGVWHHPDGAKNAVAQYCKAIDEAEVNNRPVGKSANNQ